MNIGIFRLFRTKISTRVIGTPSFTSKNSVATIVGFRTMASMVNYPSSNGKGDCPGYYIPGGSKGLIVLQEWWGLNEQIKKEAQDISGLGSGAVSIIAPDLYRGAVAKDRETAGHLMGDLDWMGAVKDVEATAKYLIGQGCTKVGVTGFCMGGALSFAAAALVPELTAAAPFYGIPSKELADLTSIKIPIQCHFAELDEAVGFSSPAEYNKLRSELERAGVTMEFHTYKAGHGFTNHESPLGTYNKELAGLALKRMMDFMLKHL